MTDPRLPVHLDPDPRYVAENESFAERQRAERNRAIRQLILAIGFIAITCLAILAAPRSAHVVPLGNKSDLPPSVTHAPFTVPPGSGIVVPAAEPLPSPATFELASAIEGGLAAWCAPTLTQCQSWGPPAKLGAVSSFTWGDVPYRVRVCRQDGDGACVAVAVVSFCECAGDRVIDLSPAAFAELAPLSRGLVAVTVERGGPSVTLPPTEAVK